MLEIEELVSNLKTYINSTKEIDNIPEKNDILDLTDKLTEKIGNAISKEGVLRIGIVGQVKAGKSSFINALLFDGNDILPKASTPMTAALTVIKYSEKLSAEVDFYSEKDWEVVERNAAQFEKILWQIARKKQDELDESRKISEKKENFIDKAKNMLVKKEDILKPEMKIEDLINNQEIFDEAKKNAGVAILGAYELLEMAKKENLEIEKYIGTTQKIDSDILSIQDLVGKLHQYVGANGKFTPITRNTTLYLNIPTLKDIELIDTPGMNDPIISRGMATRDFLSRCDTVFLLSTSSQFMGAEDTEFLVTTLPSEGVTNIILLGSKFDSVLVDEFKKYKGDIKTALKDIYQKLSTQADNALKTVIASNPNKPIMEKIKNKEVKFISGICYNIAKKGRENLDDMEKHALENLEKRYNIKLDEATLFDLANIDRIKNNDLEKIKLDKDKILENKLNDLVCGQNELFLQKLTGIEKNLYIKIDDLGKLNIDELQKRQKDMKRGFDSIANDVPQIFKELSFNIEEEIIKLISLVNKRSSKYLGIKENTKSKEESYSVKVGTERCGFLWLDTRNVYETRYKTINYKVANVLDAAENAASFINLVNEEIMSVWQELINIQSVEKELIKISLGCFELGDENFNKSSVINPVKNALRNIQIKPYQLKSSKYKEQISNYFSSSEVQDDEIYKLKDRVRYVVEDIVDDVEKSLDDKLNEIKNILEEKGNNFVNTILEYSQKEINEIEEGLKDAEGTKNRLNNAIFQINQFKIQFKG